MSALAQLGSSLIVFEISGHRFAVPALAVLAAADGAALETLQATAASIAGGLRYGSGLVPVFDLDHALDLGTGERQSRRTCLLLATGHAELPVVGMFADRVEGALPSSGLWPLPKLAASRARCVDGLAQVEGELVVNLEPSRVHELLDAALLAELKSSLDDAGRAAP